MTDITRSGARDYTPEQKQRVIDAFMRLARTGAAVHVDDLARLAGVGGRTVRAIMVDSDGVDFLLGGGDDGYRIALSMEDARIMTGRLRSQIFTMMDRVLRRDQKGFDQVLRRRQPTLL